MATWDINLNALKEELAYLFPREDDYYVFAQEVGLDPGTIIFTHKAINDWHAILEEAHKVGKVVRIIEKAYKRYPDRVDLQVAECYMHKQIEQPVNNYHSLTLSVHVNTSDPTITVFGYFTQVQRTAQFLSCWQDVITQVNKNTPGSPLLFEHCDSIKPSLQDLRSTINCAKQLLANDRTIFALDLSQQPFVNKLTSVDETLDYIIRHIQYLLDCNDKKTRQAMELRQIIQYKIAEVIQHLEDVNILISSHQQRFQQERFTSYEEPSITGQAKNTPLKLVPPVTPSQSKSIQELSSDNASTLKRSDLRKAILRFFSENELILICSDLAEEWGKETINYDNLLGRTLELKINSLVEYCNSKGKLEKLIDWLIQRDKDFGSKLQEIMNERK